MLILAQIALTSVAAWLFGAVARFARQPRVIGEIVSGIALGPTLFGALVPHAYAAVFAPASLGALRALAEIGVGVFMFTVGMSVDLTLLRNRPYAAVVVSHVSIAAPFLLGVSMAGALFARFAPAGTNAVVFALFLGVAMSITAFPVLARILAERGMTQTPVGTLALTCAAVDDVTAWCVLAVVFAVASAGDGVRAGAVAVAGVAAYAAAAVLIARPLLRRLFVTRDGEDVTASRVGLAVLVALASALATEALGVHARFGAFLAGAVLPRSGEVARRVADRLDAAVTTVLLPIFFAFSGVRANLGAVGGGTAWNAFLL
ncbi:MAG: hypothetical protein QOI11_945, partial [Candidatus Eremiobacteraeota bacterium]|nr:hypothetical protein [Candidatus Eremiobacteraeota bacterium]